MAMGRRIGCIGAMLALSSCVSALKKQCQETNWFEYGAEVARRGERLDSDTFVKSCEKEEAPIDHGLLDRGFKKGMSDYCVVDYAYLVGKRGDFLNLDLCDDKFHKELRRRHKEGLAEFCKADSGRMFGAAGKIYNGVCPADAELRFMPAYREGRRSYLQLMVSQKERSIRDADRELSDVDRELEGRRFDLLDLNRKASLIPEAGLSDEERQRRQGSIDSEIIDLRSRMRGLEDSRRKIRQTQNTLQGEIREAEKEILSLDSSAVVTSRADEELRLLAGHWNIRSALRGGIPFHTADSTLQIDGKILERRDGAQVFRREIHLDPTQSPKQIDLKVLDEPGTPQTLLGIYEFNGQEFRICHGPPGGPRPREFSSTPENQNVLSFSRR
jgi:uncharacterized protein (TIGR03067 family)